MWKNRENETETLKMSNVFFAQFIYIFLEYMKQITNIKI